MKFKLLQAIFWVEIIFSIGLMAGSRGYLTTPDELKIIAQKATQGVEPYRTAYKDVLIWADKEWNFSPEKIVECPGADEPAWLDEFGGASIVYAKALAYHLTGKKAYARQVKKILDRLMRSILDVAEGDDFPERQCMLNLAWGIPEYLYAADLIEDFWANSTSVGPLNYYPHNTDLGKGPSKFLFQNWLVKTAYYIVSKNDLGNHNWGVAGSNLCLAIADYLWDRPEVIIHHRNPPWINGGEPFFFHPDQAYQYVKKHLLDSMNGYTVSFWSRHSCDLLNKSDRNLPQLGPPVKGQITENGIVTQDARRQEWCNISRYNGEYQNYPQVHLDNLIAAAELIWRRGDDTVFTNIDSTDIPNFSYSDHRGNRYTTHLKPGRGSLRRALNAIIIDSQTPYKRGNGLWVAYRFYLQKEKKITPDLAEWKKWLDRHARPSQGICFATLTHCFAETERPLPPPQIPPPLSPPNCPSSERIPFKTRSP
ncbi:MAG: hypothetical protein Kow0037_25490 [Calditrichia bacterium]